MKLVPFVNLPLRYAGLKEKLLEAFDKTAETGQFILGDAVTQLEEALAAQCESRYAVTLGSGFDALFFSLKALEIGPGDEVITPANSFLATAGAIAATGATPVFVDVCDDFNIDVTRIEGAITDNTRAILPVHLTGQPADIDAIQKIADHYYLAVVEDAAQSIGATYKGKAVGSLGSAGCFSLHPLKNFHVFGDGGFVTTDDESIASQIKLLRNHGLKNRDECEFWGYNSRLDNVQAAMALSCLDEFPQWTARYRKIAEFYNSKLQDYVMTPLVAPDVEPVYHNYIIQTENRQPLMEHMLQEGVESKVHYPVPLHLQKPAIDDGYVPGDFPVVERQCKEILSLPIYPELTDSDIEQVADAVVSFFNSAMVGRHVMSSHTATHFNDQNHKH